MSIRMRLVLAVLVIPSAGSAHVIDEYLQGTLVTLEPDHIRLQIYLTPGVDVAEQVIGLIDRDRDGVISTDEAAAYAELLKRELIVRLDQRTLELKLTSSNFPAPDELRTGSGIIELEFSAVLSPLSAGTHRFIMENQHLPKISVHLFNAAQPRSPSIHIKAQTRNLNQSRGEIEFTHDPPVNSSRASSDAAGYVFSLAVLIFVVLASVWRLRKRPSPTT